MKTMISTLALLTVAAPAMSNQVFQDNSLVVASDNILYEYNNGALISQRNIPTNSANEMARDITILDDGRVAVFNGTFTPELLVYNGENWQSFTMPGWSTANNLSYGGITAIGDAVYVTDTYTAYDGAAKGVVKFDLASGNAQRIIDDSDYIDINVGLDGKLYALQNTYGALDVIDPASGTVLRSVALGHTSSSRGVAADAEGNIYMVSWSGYVARYSAEGTLVNTLEIGGNLHDIDIDHSGRVVTGSRFGQVYVTDTNLSDFTELFVSTSNAFVATVPSVLPPAAPVLQGTVQNAGRDIQTTLTWSTEAEGVDVYFNGQWLESVTDSNSATYWYFKKQSQEFMVCNIGTEDCSAPFIAN
ncbi:hypothetical protein [Pseudoalteromonas sp. T1lg22]|uniref:hypothetical protein n=1 Tax=Pseudoalteromonas sp. T1lg22 TaxID=2077096 RepID=UPI000CF5E841|nr:hypothetical protein [Pseudoalteromonas sp. T1lg22]